jgi:exonuclease SbcC
VANDANLAHIESSLATWTCLSQAMGNDGIMALVLDDAGPTLAALANDLLLACYGPRFTVALNTQVATAKGEMREGFEIIVHDAQTDESKPLKHMSGGQRVWIHEALTRAVALYLALNSGRRYGALFSDESDGALDTESKRRYLSMKREVLRLGGYAVEFFISQTEELVDLADAVIDVASLSVSHTPAALQEEIAA